MSGNLSQNWPIYLLFGAFIVFVVFAYINGRETEKKNKETKAK